MFLISLFVSEEQDCLEVKVVIRRSTGRSSEVEAEAEYQLLTN